MKYFFLFIISGLLLSGCSNLNKILKSSDYEYKLKKGDEFYAKQKYSQAQIIYEDVFPVMKGTAKFEDLYYKWAFCHYYQKDYLNAENIFKGFVETFPNSSKVEECRYLRAYCFYKQSPKADLDQTATMKAITYLQSFSAAYPNSARNKDVADIIDKLRIKLELKEYKSAELYYNLGYYKAAATAFTQLINNFPDSEKGDNYKLMVIKATYDYARNSVELKQEERFETVLNECADFHDRFPESKLAREVQKMKEQTQNKINSIKNEQTKAAA
ncbi:outer membrane protein assembly factor BamD [soil metagenome]